MGCNIRHNSCTRTPANPTQEHIDDACIVRKADGFMVVVGHARDNAQISLLAGTDNDNVSLLYPSLVRANVNRRCTGTKVQGL